jgi:hypothetical protein
MDIWILTSPARPAVYSPAYGARAGSYSIKGEFDPALAAVLRTPEGMEEWFRCNVRACSEDQFVQGLREEFGIAASR